MTLLGATKLPKALINAYCGIVSFMKFILFCLTASCLCQLSNFAEKCEFMQIYGMSPRCSCRQATPRIRYKHFEQKGTAYMPVLIVITGKTIVVIKPQKNSKSGNRSHDLCNTSIVLYNQRSHQANWEWVSMWIYLLIGPVYKQKFSGGV